MMTREEREALIDLLQGARSDFQAGAFIMHAVLIDVIETYGQSLPPAQAKLIDELMNVLVAHKRAENAPALGGHLHKLLDVYEHSLTPLLPSRRRVLHS